MNFPLNVAFSSIDFVIKLSSLFARILCFGFFYPRGITLGAFF